MKSDLRGLGEHHGLIEQLSKGGELYSITEKLKNEKEYWMGIRNNKVMIYYMGGKILDISSSGLLGFDPKYIAHYDNKIKIGKRFANAEDWLSKEKLLKSAIHSYQTNYNKNEKNFILPTPIIKAVFFILPKNAPNLKEVKKWFKSDKANDQESLEDYCLTHAKKYDKFNNKWIEVKYILNLIPGDFNTLEKEILVVKNIEKEDDDNYYFLKINEMRHEQTLAPLDYVRDEITLILKNKKKLQFENDLEKQINEEGVRKKYVKIY